MVTRGLLKKENGTGVWFKKDLGPYIDWYSGGKMPSYGALKRDSGPTAHTLQSDVSFTVIVPWEFM